MKKNRQKRPSFLYAVIIFLALVILALGALTLYSLQDLIDLRSKVSGLQTTVQELSDASADLVKQAQELAGLNDQLSNATSDTDTAGASGDTQGEGTLSPSHDASSFTDSADESLDNLLSQLEPLLPQNDGTWSVYVCNLMKNTEGTIDDQRSPCSSARRSSPQRGTAVRRHGSRCTPTRGGPAPRNGSGSSRARRAASWPGHRTC